MWRAGRACSAESRPPNPGRASRLVGRTAEPPRTPRQPPTGRGGGAALSVSHGVSLWNVAGPLHASERLLRLKTAQGRCRGVGTRAPRGRTGYPVRSPHRPGPPGCAFTRFALLRLGAGLGADLLGQALQVSVLRQQGCHSRRLGGRPGLAHRPARSEEDRGAAFRAATRPTGPSARDKTLTRPAALAGNHHVRRRGWPSAEPPARGDRLTGPRCRRKTLGRETQSTVGRDAKHCGQRRLPVRGGRPVTYGGDWNHFSSVQSRPTLCDPLNRSTPGLPVHHQLPEFTQTHIHRVGDAIQPSHPLSSPSPPAPNPSQHQSLFQ